MKVNSTKLAELISNLEPNVVADPEKLQYVLEDFASVINSHDDSISLLAEQADDNRIVLTYNATSGKLEKIEEKDGTLVVKTTNLSYDGNGRISTIVEIDETGTLTSTFVRNVNGKITSIERS